ncbi:Acyl transferase [Dirofilaria immitis]
MDYRFLLNGTTNEGLRNVNKEKLLTIISYILHTYAYLFIGFLLLLVNIPIFLLIVMRKALRNPYIVLATTFFNSELTGISAILLGVKRIIASINGEQLIDHHKCVLNIPILLLTSFFLNGWNLLMNSVERLCVIAFPLYYYTHSTQISYSLVIIQYLITVIAITSTAVASLIEPSRQVSNFCCLQTIYSPHFYITLLILTSTASSLSVLLMVIVVIILKKKFSAQLLANHPRNRNLSHFLKNQKRYTQTSLISCCFTFFFVVLPSIAENIYMMETSTRSRVIVICCVYLRLLNCCNTVLLFAYRQSDLRQAAIRCIKNHLYGWKQHVQSVKIIGFRR